MRCLNVFALSALAALALFTPNPAAAQYKPINLTSDQPGLAQYTDPNLLDPWSLVFLPGAHFLITDAHSGLASLYGPSGKPIPLTITVPPAPSQPFGPTGTPTGLVMNLTSRFVITKDGKSGPATFLFNTLDGTISGWNLDVDPNNAVIVIDNSAEAPFPASYTAMALGRNSKGQTVLYAADSGGGPILSNNRIDMFDEEFHYLGSFGDAGAPSNMTVFGLQNIHGKLYVTYAAFSPLNGGVVDVFDSDGHMLQRLASNDPSGPLEEPWAVTLAPDDFGRFSHALLVGNFGDGRISAFNPKTGKFLGQFADCDGKAISDGLGLWALGFRPDHAKDKSSRLFFASGINAEADGLFGDIVAVTCDTSGVLH